VSGEDLTQRREDAKAPEKISKESRNQKNPGRFFAGWNGELTCGVKAEKGADKF